MLISKKTDEFPESSFIQVVNSLNESSPSLGMEGKQNSAHQKNMNIKPAVSVDNVVEESTIVDHDHQDVFFDNNKKESDSISAVSLDTLDVDAVSDIERSLKAKNRLILASSTIAMIFVGVWAMTRRDLMALNRGLLAQLDEQKRENELLEKKVDEIARENSAFKLQNMMVDEKETKLFEFDNCFFKFQASAALGECGESWVGWFNSDFFEQNEEEI
ncbi:predicted protein [Chaetoceros tenuissimus]|uniref:Uncharacterized protein n=1 Tax=Chaetoceros tenuissimus TaxID=426638 RepID=A0AAD3D3W8_9STRA|nr:predicted protein [Chaetoceros tenuissimus]